MTKTSSLRTTHWSDVFRTRVLPHLGVRCGAVDRPTLTFVVGQQGSGKTTVLGNLVDGLGEDCTQQLSGDAILASLPEMFMDRDDDAVRELLDEFKKTTMRDYYTLLLDHAFRLRANVVWELARPFDTSAIASLARSVDYKVRCLVLATPLLESWVSTLKRETLRVCDPNRMPVRVSFDKIISCFSQWPSHIAWSEDHYVFDEVKVIDRDGNVFFENHLVEDVGKFRWAETPFAFESLVMERLHACDRNRVNCLIAEWEVLRADSDIALQNHLAWPWSSIVNTGSRLRVLRDDPSIGYNLLDPSQSSNIDAREGWIERLRQDLIAVQENADAAASHSLSSRSARLLTLVSSV